MTVENLEIKVKTDADQAAAKLTSLSNALGRVQSSAKSVSGNTNGAAKGIKNVGEAAKKANKPLGNFISSLKRIAFYRIIRSIIKSITQAMKEGMEWAYNFAKTLPDSVDSSGRFAAALDRMATASSMLKAQLGSALISVLSALEPILAKLIDLALKAADAISQFFAAFTGTTYVKATGGLVKAFQSGAKAAKEWRNQLLGFDEINRLNEPSQGGGGSSSPLSGITGADTPLDSWARKIHDNLALIETTASGFALGLGLILTFSGANIPLGLALIVAGAYGLARSASLDWSKVRTETAASIHNVATVVGLGALAVGAVLAFSGANIPLGLALMAAGVAGFATAAAIRWGLDGEVGSSLARVAQEAMLATFAVGTILALSGVATPLGLAMMGASIVGYATTLDWDYIGKKVKSAWESVTNYYNTHIKKYITAEYWQGKIAGIKSAFSRDLNEIETTIYALVISPIREVVMWAERALSDLAALFGIDVNSPSFQARMDPFGANSDIWGGINADGGFVDSGQLFIAREAGPELVGSMGGHTAVANNDQIVEGIKQGVYDAVVAANANGNSDVSVRVYLDSREIRAGQERLARAWG